MGLLRAFGFAVEGVSYLIRTQRNARIEVAIGVGVVVLAAWLRVGTLEWAILILTIALVLGLEALNSALEIAVTLSSPEHQPLAKAAKDVAAASVLFACAAAVLVGGLLFLPRLMLGY